MQLSKIWETAKESVGLWKRHNTALLASSLAYYAIFSLVPILVLVIMIARRVLGDEFIQATLVDGAAGEGDAGVLVQLLTESVDDSRPGFLPALILLGTLIFGASHIFTQLKSALNQIWEVEPKPRNGVMNWVITQLIALTIVPAVVILLLLSLFMDVWLATFTQPLVDWLPGMVGVYAVRLLKALIAFGIVLLLIATIYKVLPDVAITWRDVWVGAGVTAILLTGGQFAIGAYLAWADLESIYGLAGWIIFVLFWVYATAQILLFGAEFTEVYALRYGPPLRPTANARPLSDDSPIARRERDESLTDDDSQPPHESSDRANDDSRHDSHAPSPSPAKSRPAGRLPAAILAFVIGLFVGAARRS